VAAIPVPVTASAAVGLVVDVLLTVNVPDAAPRTVGSNSIPTVAVWVGVSVCGNVGPERVKPVPVSVTELTVTDPVPEEVKITVCVVGVFNTTLPNAMLVALMLNMDVAAFTVNVTESVAVA
jgi:hypothetical protein